MSQADRDTDVEDVVAELRALEPQAVQRRRTQLVRWLFFDKQLMPWEIEARTGLARTTVRNLCLDDERYEEQTDRNRRRRRNPEHERYAALYREQQGRTD